MATRLTDASCIRHRKISIVTWQKDTHFDNDHVDNRKVFVVTRWILFHVPTEEDDHNNEIEMEFVLQCRKIFTIAKIRMDNIQHVQTWPLSWEVLSMDGNVAFFSSNSRFLHDLASGESHGFYLDVNRFSHIYLIVISQSKLIAFT